MEVIGFFEALETWQQLTSSRHFVLMSVNHLELKKPMKEIWKGCCGLLSR